MFKTGPWKWHLLNSVYFTLILLCLLGLINIHKTLQESQRKHASKVESINLNYNITSYLIIIGSASRLLGAVEIQNKAQQLLQRV